MGFERSMSASAASPNAGAQGAAGPPETVSSRRLLAFLIMVFGMFMSILDIQIVSASLSDIQAGLSASSSEVSWVQTAYLHCGSDRDSAVRLPVTCIWYAIAVRYLRLPGSPRASFMCQVRFNTSNR